MRLCGLNVMLLYCESYFDSVDTRKAVNLVAILFIENCRREVYSCTDYTEQRRERGNEQRVIEHRFLNSVHVYQHSQVYVES